MTEPSSYKSIIDAVLASGLETPSRYGPTREVLGMSLILPAGRMVRRKGISEALGWMELTQLIAGVFDPEALKKVAPKAQHELFTSQMAYGPRLKDQMHNVIRTLRRDPLSRQAVLFVGKPEDGPTSDLPCTETIQLLLRDESLNAVVSMRSWDLIKGLPYDLMMFGGLVQALAAVLDRDPGWVRVTAGSAHVYEEDLERLEILETTRAFSLPQAFCEWSDAVRWATTNLCERDLNPSFKPTAVTVSTKWGYAPI